MRLNRLDLTRYGIFSDYSLDFGEPRPGAPDLHVVFGPNEAGKSTAFSAFLDLLFGIEPRSAYDFLHPYSTMRIGGSLEVGGLAREFARIKKAQSSLLDGDDLAVADAVILGDLGGIDRAAYTTMFSLDDDTLEAGGESILESRGDLGQLLFSASAGLADLSRKLVELRSEADAFYRFRGRGGQLHDLKARLAELKARREQLDTLATEYAQLVATRRDAKARYDEALAERGRVGAKLAALQARLGALPKLGTLRALRRRLEPLAEIPAAPLGWAEELPGLQRQVTELAARADEAEKDIAKRAAELEGIVVDARVLGLADRIERLADLRARYMTADKDLPERVLELRDADQTIARILTRIERAGEADASRLLLGASTVGALRELMEKRSGIETRVASAQVEATEAQRRLESVRAKLAAAGGDEAPRASRAAMAALEAALAAARDTDRAARRRAAERAREERAADLAQRLAALRPWAGDAGMLRGLTVPEREDVERWKLSVAAAQAEVERRDAEIERLTAECRRLGAERDALSRAVGVVGDEEAGRLRAAREQAWAAHRRRLDAETADAFEAALRRDDIAMSGRLAHAGDAARLTDIARLLEVTAADSEVQRERRDAAARRIAALRVEIGAAVHTMAPGLQEPLAPAALETWLERREQALASAAALEAAERELRAAEDDAREVRDRIVEATAAAGFDVEADAGVERLVSLAQAALEREAARDALRSEAAEREREADARKRAREQAEADEAEWTRHWDEVCAGCWLGERGAAPSLPAVRETLASLEELGPLVGTRAGLAERIEKMKADQARFGAQAAALARELELETEGDALERAGAVVHALGEARRAEAARRDASKRLEEARDRRAALAEQQAIHERRKAEMLVHFGVGSLADVDARLRDLERRSALEEQAEAAEREIAAALHVPSVREAEASLEGLDPDAVEAEIAASTRRYQDLDGDAQRLHTEYTKAAEAVDTVGGDDAVARLEERRRTTLLEIEEGATRYLRLRLGIAAAEQALRLYRDEHRSSMLARASEAFRAMSRGAYTRLATQPDKDREVLIAAAANGATKLASALSKGTRFQLYLALRVAGYHEFVRSRPPVPFVADDILETFDDLRAEETFKLFAGMAEVGQVIYLTHHRHLCEIARRACPEVRIHELVRPVPKAAAGT